MNALTATKEVSKTNSKDASSVSIDIPAVEKAAFVHLHVHSHYSLLQAVAKIPDLVKAAKEMGMDKLALTDAGNMYGAIEFYKECEKQGIKPILGVDFYVAVRTRLDKEPRIDNKRSRLVLLAKNVEGYKNLIKLVTESNIDGFYYKPRIDKELLEKYNEGLLCIMPSFSGEIAQALRGSTEGDGNTKAHDCAKYYRKVFVDDFYLELTHHPEVEGHADNMKKVRAFAKAEKLPLVAAHDTYYIPKDDNKARDTLVSIQDQFSERNLEDEADFSFITQAEAKEFFKDDQEALKNTRKVADICDLKLELGKWLFPNFIVPSGLPADEELKNLTYAGLDRRRLELTPEIKERVDYELSVIGKKGYAPYFLVVADLLNYAHANGILTTIRGSVAGSMVTYLTGITTVNPMEYKLPFERFLNPERPSAPDIDMDYADNRRDQMIRYATQKYGHDKVAQIGTFGTMMARGAVRDVARALKFPYATGDRISKLIPLGAQGAPMTIDKAIGMTPELKELYEKDVDTKTIIDMAKKIEGCARHISVHAAGVVISPIPLTEIVPLQLDPKGEGRIITQYDMHSVDENNAGLLKFDFLGITNLSQLAEAVNLVEKIENIKVDLDNIPIDDAKTFAMLARGETIGLFQLNGAGMTRYLKELKPSSIHDINAMVALYRPGPMETIPEYIERKNDPSLIKYEDPRMEKFLKESYGLIVYQDDLLFCAIDLAGYSWLEADKFRKAVGKKVHAEMAAQKDKFLEGIVKNGQTKKFADRLWKLFEPFQSYGFNKAHAASYGRVAYQTSYMKANFPAIYMAAVLTGAHGDVVEMAEYINECKRMGVHVLPPNVNESFGNFSVVKAEKKVADDVADAPDADPATKLDAKENPNDKIRFGLYSIKNFGEGIANAIIEERKKGGPFNSLEDFLNRIKDKNLNKKSLEALVKAGAMDEFGDRGVLLANLPDLLEYNKEQHSTPENQDSLFGGPSVGGASAIQSHLKLNNAGTATQAEKLKWEKELLGLYITGHPLDKYKKAFEARDINIKKLLEEGKEEKEYVIAGIIEETKEIVTKKNVAQRMMFARIADLTESMEIVIFPKTYEQFKNLLVVEKCVVIKGKLSKRNGGTSILVDTVKALA